MGKYLSIEAYLARNMEEAIEVSIESVDGVVDCRLEPQQEDEQPLYFSVTILYPHMVDGFSRSEIYCYNMYLADKDKILKENLLML